MNTSKRNQIIFYVFSFFVGFYLANGTTVWFEQTLKFSYGQIFSLGAVYMVIFIVFNVPGGGFADIICRKKILITGSCLLVIGAITTGISRNFTQVFCSFFAWAA